MAVSRIGPAVCLALVLAGSAPARAQPASEAQQEAVRLFEQSVAEYRAGRFQQAADLLRRAYDLHPEPTLLYNLGRALEGLGDEAGAIDGYSRYLAAQPGAPDRGAIEARLQSLRLRLDERRRLAEEAERARQEREREREERERREAERETAAAGSGPGALPWVVAAAGGAALAAGGVLGLVASAEADDADGEATQRDVWDRYEGARSKATAANVCFVAGGVVAAVGLAWGIVGSLGGRGPAGEGQDGDAEVAWLPPAGVVVSW